MTERIALATIALDNMAGGLERNIIYLANHFSNEGREVHILTFDLPGAVSFYEINEGVTWHRLGRTKPHTRISFADRLKLILRIRRLFTGDARFSRLVCFHHGILARFFLATIFTRTSIICSERNSLTIYDHISRSKWNLNFLLLFFTTCITVQFPNYVRQYPRPLRARIKLVSNPVFPAADTRSAGRKKIILSVGRHSAQKRFDLLIEACRIVFRSHPDWRLVIIGNGSLSSSLRDLIDRYRLQDSIDLIDAVGDLSAQYNQAVFFCQPSQWEGFPNAQAEAMAAGVIPIGFRCTAGVADLIEDGVNGYLSPDKPSPEALAKTLVAAIEAEQDRERLSENAREVAECYSVARWRRSWDSVLGLQRE